MLTSKKNHCGHASEESEPVEIGFAQDPPARPAAFVASDSAQPAISTVPAANEELMLLEVIDELAQIQRESTLGTAIRIGELIVTRIFCGDLAALSSRGQKDASFRKLAEHPRLPFDKTTLWRAVRIYEIVQRFPGIARANYLGVTHIRAVIGLPPAIQENLLIAAERDRWSAAQIEARAAVHRKGSTAPERSAPATFRKLKAQVKAGAFTVDRAWIAGISASAAREASDLVDALETWCEEMRKALGSR